MAKRTTVVISQGQSQNPAKRDLEENLVAALLMEPGLELVVIPHLYDLKADGTGVLALQGVSGPVVVLSWLYERAARWILDRYGVHGKEGISLLKTPDDSDDDDDELERARTDAEADRQAEADREGVDKLRVIENRPIPDRRVYCIDLRLHNSIEPFVREVRRIADENQTQVVELMGWLGGARKPSRSPDSWRRRTTRRWAVPARAEGVRRVRKAVRRRQTRLHRCGLSKKRIVAGIR